jgi:hypothetical protein
MATVTGITAERFKQVEARVGKAGPTAQRPTGPDRLVGHQYFDTTINRPIWWTGSVWINAAGATV